MTDYTELVKALRCKGLSKECDSCGYGYHYCPDSECNDACNVERIIDDAAAAIEELQAQLPKRGKWKPFDLTYGRSIYSCSVCEQATEVPMCVEKPMYAYCPNCGAKMEVQK